MIKGDVPTGFCSYPGCNATMTVAQKNTSTNLYGKPYCTSHEKHANEEATEASDAVMIDIQPYTKHGWEIDKKGSACKTIDGKDVRINIAYIDTGRSKTDSISVNKKKYELGENVNIDISLKKLFKDIPNKNQAKVENKEPDIGKTLMNEEIKQPDIKITNKEFAKPEKNNTNLIPLSQSNAIVRPAVSAIEAIAAWKEFNDLKAAIITDSDRQKIGDKSFIKKSGWRKLATFFNLTDRIIEEQQMVHSDGGWTWKIKVIAVAPNGRTSEGVGICSTLERKFAHIEHDTYTTAHTRAKNRAISDMIAGGEVSAEEVE